MVFRQGSELISFVNYQDYSGGPRWEGWRRRVGQQSRGDAKKQELLQKAEMSILRGAKEGIWVTCGFPVVPFTEIENKGNGAGVKGEGLRLRVTVRLHIGGAPPEAGVSF